METSTFERCDICRRLDDNEFVKLAHDYSELNYMIDNVLICGNCWFRKTLLPIPFCETFK